MFENQGVKPVLRRHDVAHALVGTHRADTADTPIEPAPEIHQRIDIHRLVCAMEATDSEVNDPDGDLPAVVTRLLHGTVEDFERAFVKGLQGHRLLHCAHRQPAHELVLGGPAGEEHRQAGDGRGGRQVG